jgi:hypothetical protein
MPPGVGPDGSELLRSCNAAVRLSDGEQLTPDDITRAVWCTGYIGGFLDGLALMGWKGATTKVCLPKNGIENDQAARVLVKYLKAHPEFLHESGRASLIVALGEAFACK